MGHTVRPILYMSVMQVTHCLLKPYFCLHWLNHNFTWMNFDDATCIVLMKPLTYFLESFFVRKYFACSFHHRASSLYPQFVNFNCFFSFKWNSSLILTHLILEFNSTFSSPCRGTCDTKECYSINSQLVSTTCWHSEWKIVRIQG